nr:protein-disulfide reductase DsbD [Caldimonas sp.]
MASSFLPIAQPFRTAFGRLLMCFVALALVAVAALRPAHAEDDFLPPEQAFRFSARPHDARSVEVTFAIAPGYYLYREQFKFAATGASLGAPTIPPGKVKYDETFQKNVETYRNAISIVVPVEQAGAEFRLAVTSQGCADAGLCYPPMQSTAAVALTGFGGAGTARVVDAGDGANAPVATPASIAAAPAAAATSESSGIEAVLRGGAFWSVVGAFFVAGVLLSLTPCVLPMLPIVSSIVVGQAGTPALASAGGGSGNATPGGVSRGRGFALAASYSFGMAVVYTAFGVVAGLAGEGLAAALQNAWVLGAFALGLVALSLSMFGVYELQLPSALTSRFAAAAHKLPAGRVAGVCAMGGVSALIVSPCVAAPLAGALLYLSQTRDVWLGGTALFSLAAGMSVPLLLVGASAGALLPRAGAWMVEVKAAFGVLLLGVAVWTVQPVLPGPLALALWGLLALFAAGLLVHRARALQSTERAAVKPPAPGLGWRQAIAALLGLVGVLQVVGAASGATDPLQPLARFTAQRDVDPAPGMPRFQTVKSVADLDAILKSAGKPVMLDFYADWCVSCKEMERFTFSDAGVQKKLAGALLLKADVTANDAQDRELLKRFSLFGPPGTIFFDAAGNEVRPARLIGYQNSSRFLETLKTAGL